MERLAHYRAAVQAGFYTDDDPQDHDERLRLCYMKLARAICQAEDV
jgi:hypothetical protein